MMPAIEDVTMVVLQCRKILAHVLLPIMDSAVKIVRKFHPQQMLEISYFFFFLLTSLNEKNSSVLKALVQSKGSEIFRDFRFHRRNNLINNLPQP